MDIIHQEYVQQKVKVHLKPSVQLIANVVQTKTLQAGESVSYGATYTATDQNNNSIVTYWICRWLFTHYAR